MTTGIFGVYIFAFWFQFFNGLFKLDVHLDPITVKVNLAGIKSGFMIINGF